MTYERNYFIHYYDTDFRQRASILSIMKYFEDIAVLQSDSLNIGLEYYDNQNIGWLLHKWDIQISEYPKFKDTIKVSTEPLAFKNFYANRSFEFFDSNNHTLGSAKTLWIFIDRLTNRPKIITPEIYKSCGLENTSEQLTKLCNINQISSPDAEINLEVHLSDIDTNEHVNNIKYAEWALGNVPLEIQKEFMLSRLKIIYKKELMPGQSVKSVMQKIDSGSGNIKFLHSIKRDDLDYCLLESTWQK